MFNGAGRRLTELEENPSVLWNTNHPKTAHAHCVFHFIFLKEFTFEL